MSLTFPVYRFIDISPDLAVCPCPGMVVKRIDDDHCALFIPGQSAIDGGFLIERPWDAVIDELNSELLRAVEEGYDLFDGDDEDDEDDEGKGKTKDEDD